VRTYDVPANNNIALHVGIPIAPASPIAPVTDCLLSVTPIFAVPQVTDAAGLADLPLLTNGAGRVGVSLSFQSVSLDTGATMFNVTLSNAARVQFGFYAFTGPPNAF
jgi:hypothetical protein